MMKNKDQKIQAIREACIAVNPEIVELKFGCDIRFKLYEEPFTYIREIRNHYHQIIKKWGNKITEIPDLNEIIILGRPIRLADVFHLFGDKGILSKENMHGTVCRWNLLCDSLEDQEEPTINFIHELITK